MSTVPPSPACATTRVSRPIARIAAKTPVATAAALPNNEVHPGICQLLSGYGVEKTSKQPVALTATRSPPLARMAASAHTARPAPHRTLTGAVTAVDQVGRLGSDCAERSVMSSNRLPTAKDPTW